MNGALELADSGTDNEISENVQALKIQDKLEVIFIVVFVVDILIKIYFQFANIRNRDTSERSNLKDTYDKEMETQVSSSSGKSKDVVEKEHFIEDPRV